MPLVSVIIPLYNQEEYILDALKSVFEQTYTNIELIILNDGSSDNSVPIVETYIKEHPTLNIQLLSQKNKGLASTRNNAIAVSKGSYILPLDADDKIKPTMLESCLKVFEENSSVDIVYTDVYYFGETNQYVSAGEIKLHSIKYNNCLNYCSVYKKEVWEKVGGYTPSMDYGYEDWEFWIEAKKLHFNFFHIYKDLFEYRVKKESMFQDALAKDALLRSKIILNNQDIFSQLEVGEAINNFKEEQKSDKIYFYAKENINEVVNGVLLYGGYSGYQNFGDILQLKWAIEYHKEQTGFTPIAICDLASLGSFSNTIEDIYENFEVEHIIFYSTLPYDVSFLGLQELNTSKISHFHNYGGGVINSFWVEWYYYLIENIYKQFQFEHFILTGQQIDPKIASNVNKFLSSFPIKAVGVRDMTSLESMQNITSSDKVHNTFDDAFEAVCSIASLFNLKKEKNEIQEIYLHMNITPYTHEDNLDIIQTFKEYISLLKHTYSQIELTLLVAFDDMRIVEVQDSLSVAKKLETIFDFVTYKVLNLAQIAYKKEPTKSIINISPDALFISSSYHIAMLGKILGMQTFMFHFNNYYNQKREGLRLKNETFFNFIETGKQHIDKTFHKDMQEIRNEWKHILNNYFSKNDAITNIELQESSKGFRYSFKDKRSDIYQTIHNTNVYANFLKDKER